MNALHTNYHDMTVSERIDASGRMNEFNDAITDRDLETVIVILDSLQCEPDEINSVVNDLGFFR